MGIKTAILLLTIYLNIVVNGMDVDFDQISSQLPPELANSNITLDDVKTVLKDKCRKVAGEEAGETAYSQIENGAREAIECISGIVNTTAIHAEIEQARPIGELDAVFNKYCEKRSEALDCVQNFTGRMDSCLTDEERKHSDVFTRILTSLLNFVCHKGGDQIALFVAEKGPECLESNTEAIRNCVNSTFSQYLPKSGVGPNTLTNVTQFLIGPKQCSEMNKLESCIVTALEKCEEITPANIVESMFRFIKNETTCKAESTSAHQKAGAGLITVTMGLIPTSIILISKKWIYKGFN